MTSLSKALEGVDFQTIIGENLNNPATKEDKTLYLFIADRAASKITVKCGMQSGKVIHEGKILYWLYTWNLPYRKKNMPLLYVTGKEKEYLDLRERFLNDGKF